MVRKIQLRYYLFFSVHVRGVPGGEWALPEVLSPPPADPDLAQQPQEPGQEGGQAPAHAQEVNLW